ncbi:MAG: prohibitin family protein [Gammaproteobacteria bacterium]|jgi:regulator of protease activity HflC (stomatin/prohibitin superfamily)|nr:prohibitin family protein [Gammaproteobacteria bacterium]
MTSFAKRFAHWFRDHLPIFVVLTLSIAILIVFLWSRIFIIIRAGEAGVMYRTFTTGTQTDVVYPEGLHIVWPFNELTRYTTRTQVLLHEFTVLTNRGLPITLRLAVRFHPIYELVGLLHQRVGPEYPERIILPQIESVLRRQIGQHSPEDIYTNKAGVLSNIITLAIEEVGRRYVNVEDIIIRELSLPESVRAAIESKLIFEQESLAYKFRLEREKREAERKRIEALGTMVYQDIISATLTDRLVKWQAVQATQDLAASENAKVVIIGSGKEGLPVILGNQ